MLFDYQRFRLTSLSNTIAVDFWKLPDQRLTQTLTEELEKNFYARCPPEKRPVFTQEIPVEGHDDQSTSRDNGGKIQSQEDKSKAPKYDASLVKAIHATFFWHWWGAGALKFCSGMC